MTPRRKKILIAALLTSGLTLAINQAAHGQPARHTNAAARRAVSPSEKTVHSSSKVKKHPDKQRLSKISNPGKQRFSTEKTSGDDTTGQEVMAGWYGKMHHGRAMANGKPFDMYGATIAHCNLPLGTKVELENPKTGEKAEAVVTDRGPSHRGRDLDLSYGLAERLSFVKKGAGKLKMRVL